MDKDKEFEAFLARHGLTVAENWVLRLVELEERRKEDVVAYTLGVFQAAGFGHCLPSREELERALDSLLSKGQLQVITEEALGAIQEELRRDPALGPTWGLPEIGNVDFTLSAAQYRDSLRPASFFARIVGTLDCGEGHGRFLCRAKEPLLEWITDEHPGCIITTEPYPIGPWRSSWWRWHPGGFCIDVEEETGEGRC